MRSIAHGGRRRNWAINVGTAAPPYDALTILLRTYGEVNIVTTIRLVELDTLSDIELGRLLQQLNARGDYAAVKAITEEITRRQQAQR